MGAVKADVCNADSRCKAMAKIVCFIVLDVAGVVRRVRVCRIASRGVSFGCLVTGDRNVCSDEWWWMVDEARCESWGGGETTIGQQHSLRSQTTPPTLHTTSILVVPLNYAHNTTRYNGKMRPLIIRP